MNKKCMKKIVLTFVSLLMGGLCSVLVACSDEEHTVPVFPEDGSGEIEIKPDQKYDWETNRQSILANTDIRREKVRGKIDRHTWLNSNSSKK